MKSASVWLIQWFFGYSECRRGGDEFPTTSRVIVQVRANSIGRGEYLFAYWTWDWVAGCSLKGILSYSSDQDLLFIIQGGPFKTIVYVISSCAWKYRAWGWSCVHCVWRCQSERWKFLKSFKLLCSQPAFSPHLNDLCKLLDQSRHTWNYLKFCQLGGLLNSLIFWILLTGEEVSNQDLWVARCDCTFSQLIMKGIRSLVLLLALFHRSKQPVTTNHHLI